jgi:transcriptional regulator with XRE-family HTH domain
VTTIDGRHFGNRLREARVQAGFSQSELEELSGIPKARLSRYENGHVEPSIQTLARLARALNVSEASLLGDQRAILEGFFNVLSSRGVHIASADQGARLANAVADMVRALGGMQSFGADDGIQHVPATADATDPLASWADAPAGISAGAPGGADIS